jgi:hypoxanthine-DNA glycosylase
VIGRDCRVLVLGSFPSVASLAARRYYAHPRNRFWPIVGACLGLDLAALAYGERLTRVKAAGLGIWDVYASCERAGSLDAAIVAPVWNDFSSLRRRAPALARVCFNGATSARAKRLIADLGYETVVLPSTSPANASQPLSVKLARWRAALSVLGERRRRN